jgi:hypothetical protein
MNHQTNIHLHDGDRIETLAAILSTGDTPALTLTIRGADHGETTIALFFPPTSDALVQLERLAAGIEDLRERVHEALELAVPKPFGYTRPVLVPEPGSTTV